MVCLTPPQAILELTAFPPTLLSQLAWISGSHVPSGVKGSLWGTSFTFLTSASCFWRSCSHWVGWGQACSEYTASQGSHSLHRVLSSQLLVLCKLKPSLVVELSRELLEFVGSVSSIRSRASMFTCVVSSQPPSHHQTGRPAAC